MVVCLCCQCPVVWLLMSSPAVRVCGCMFNSYILLYIAQCCGLCPPSTAIIASMDLQCGLSRCKTKGCAPVGSNWVPVAPLRMVQLCHAYCKVVHCKHRTNLITVCLCVLRQHSLLHVFSAVVLRSECHCLHTPLTCLPSLTLQALRGEAFILGAAQAVWHRLEEGSCLNKNHSLSRRKLYVSVRCQVCCSILQQTRAWGNSAVGAFNAVVH